MPKFTIYLNEEDRETLRGHPEINRSELFRRALKAVIADGQGPPRGGETAEPERPQAPGERE